MMWAALFLFPLDVRAEACLQVPEDRIYARDIAGAVPALAELPGDQVLGYAPEPGARRVFTGSALERLAHGAGISLQNLPNVCVERQHQPLTADQVASAIRTAAAENLGEHVVVSVSDWGPKEVPQGKLVFSGPPRPSPDQGAREDAFWRGYILYGNRRRLPVWAKALVTATSSRVVALVDLEPGKIVTADQVRVEPQEISWQDDRLATELDEVEGSTPRTLIHAGDVILRNQVIRVPDVSRGDRVVVTSISGRAQITIEAQAQSNGFTGDWVTLRNATSGKEFRARITAKGRAVIQNPAIPGTASVEEKP